MKPLKITEIAKVVGGKLINCNKDIILKSVSTRVFGVKPEYLYIYLTYSKSDYNPNPDVEQAIKNGAAAIMVPCKIDCKVPQIIVENTDTALRTLCKHYRKKFDIPVIAVTGTSGKTSTKDLIALVLSERFNTHKTLSNVNDLIGVPMTTLQINDTHQISVIEIGLRSYGHIKKGVDIVRPSIGVITSIGTAHISSFGSKENIMKAKMEVATYFDKNDILIINGDDPLLSTIKEKPYKIIRISLNGKGEYNAKDVRDLGEKGVEFKCDYKGEEHLFKLKVPGIHNVYNAMFAIAIGDLFDIEVDDVKRGIVKFQPDNLRVNIVKMKNNAKIILDCYTSELDSMKAGINVLKSFGGNKKIAVLGSMYGCGNLTEEIHREIGRYVIGKCDILVTVGGNARYINEEAKDKLEGKHCETKEEACSYLKNIIQKDDVILINGGRILKLEQIANYLLQNQ
ncbi:UDP-N-acetylmuramoyl-tripeptide--D-alanyl-D-alanine ligase [Clostridium cellulovorans]|uniref:UDP-N-acetylmuramoyl-tripeptide--D-alanyl-D-alanine ligase n=1 Tax=Clostridium cellulovorans (strain ATCC 35296 / DSM 3052 / OCM 3 / 743B) TaxID=573061 RepID=D9SQQ9_CLOC7|nr:UDP-N-acetylmuramoyl-tripeptide--D-alanyl-D-alanine ligase [Clostridium cellulovorans]ADL52265.1 UDP-N-acetylmuramoylalanyl-D-glutamyl-2,6-diaminopimelate/D-alanyl-D-alanyl ligase [Clostridium cellulovorans 743B]